MALSYPERAAEIDEHLCTHPAHGYSQPNRAGIGTGGVVGETITLSDGTKVGISAGDRDCSTACIECYAAQGIDVGGATYTGNMRACMTSTGNFKWHPWGSGYTAKRGDIYLNETHHTAMCLGGGKLGEFSRSELHSTHGAKGDQDGWESHVTDFYIYSKGWDGVLEYVGPEPKEDDMTAEQEEMLKFIFDHMHWDDAHFSGLGNLVAQMPITYGPEGQQTTASIGDRLAYIDAHTHSVDEKLGKILELLGAK